MIYEEKRYNDAVDTLLEAVRRDLLNLKDEAKDALSVRDYEIFLTHATHTINHVSYEAAFEAVMEGIDGRSK